MATKTILVQRKFCIYSTFLDTTLQAEEERLEGESIEDGIMRVHKQLEQTADRLRKEANPNLYQDSKTVTSGYYAVDSPYAPAATYSAPGTIPIISKDAEKIEIAIDNATTLEELNKIKEANPVLPYPILLQLNTKMEILRIEANNRSMGEKNSK